METDDGLLLPTAQMFTLESEKKLHISIYFMLQSLGNMKKSQRISPINHICTEDYKCAHEVAIVKPKEMANELQVLEIWDSHFLT